MPERDRSHVGDDAPRVEVVPEMVPGVVPEMVPGVVADGGAAAATAAADSTIVAHADDRRQDARDDPDRRRRRDQAFALARAAEPHDPAIGGHLRRINALVRCLATELGLGTEEAERLGDDAMLHDVGKLHVPAALLSREGPLDAAERAIVAGHTTAGEAFLRGRPGLSRAALIARHHHEAWDGGGHPDGLRGLAIPLAARITAAADVLDALAAARSYKPAWTWDDAVAHVRGLAGRSLDPGVVLAVVAADRSGALEAVWHAAEADTVDASDVANATLAADRDFPTGVRAA